MHPSSFLPAASALRPLRHARAPALLRGLANHGEAIAADHDLRAAVLRAIPPYTLRSPCPAICHVALQTPCSPAPCTILVAVFSSPCMVAVCAAAPARMRTDKRWGDNGSGEDATRPFFEWLMELIKTILGNIFDGVKNILDAIFGQNRLCG